MRREKLKERKQSGKETVKRTEAIDQRAWVSPQNNGSKNKLRKEKKTRLEQQRSQEEATHRTRERAWEKG